MASSFNSRTYNIGSLLGRASFPDFDTRKVVVPKFQRPYSWEKKHIAAYWEDVIDYQRQQESQGAHYFLGPVVIIPEDSYIGLLDGQQRLATTTLLLSAIRDVARAKGGTPGADLARDIQRDFLLTDDDSNEFALTLGEIDKLYFQETVQSDPPDEGVKATIRSHRLIRQAKRFFDQEVETYLEGYPSSEVMSRLKDLRTTVTSRLKLVVIEVASEEEAYIIFESLNDRGLRLQVPDLLLNYLMRQASSEKERQDIKTNWDQIIEALGHKKVSDFLRRMWVSHFGDVKSQALYRVIRDRIKNEALTSFQFAKLCASEADFYLDITDVRKENLGNAAAVVDVLVNRIQSDKAIPALMAGLRCLPKTQFQKLAKLILSFVVRHDVFANLNHARSEELLYQIAQEIQSGYESGENATNILKNVREKLQSNNPTKDNLLEASARVDLGKREATYILGEIANHMQKTGKALSVGEITLEHIFPQNAEATQWPNHAALEGYEWHLGNLSILEEKLNKDAGRKKFEEKRKYYEKSVLEMNKDLAANYGAWGEEVVLERAKKLAKLADTVWRVQ